MGIFRKKVRFSDREIIEVLQSYDGSKVERMERYLFEKAFPHFLHSRKAKKILSDPDDRHKAYVDAFLKFRKAVKREQFQSRNEASLATFFFSIFEARCIDLKRKNDTKKNAPHQVSAVDFEEQLAGLSAPGQDVLRQLLAKQDLERIKVILQTKEFRGKECYELLLLAAKGYLYQEIAEMRGKTEGTVKTTISDCRSRLKKNAAAQRIFENAGWKNNADE